MKGINFDKTFALTPTFGALRMIFSISCLKKWLIHTFDVKVAFLHSLIKKTLYIWPPKGIELPGKLVLKLKKELYRTKRAARSWWAHLKEILQQIGFKMNGKDPSMYYFDSKEGQEILWIHVDHGALTGSSFRLLDYIASELNRKLQIKWDNVINGLAGLSIVEDNQEYKFHQMDLCEKLISLSPGTITVTSPLPSNCDLQSNPLKVMDKEYLKKIGMLLYIAQG
ncbi:hypothetical protein O181_000590 [Austropuccinia psidii MF-1]|uniref:Reverse transcriptase Ty1/copia-type domain-containing protein n=1 Tax=Austropuccinia psidii MF-1 TaxID=1389203 RepID=A0A9Q3B9B3_9BASI|nr:hypothetical protein [Austropuccinia psidii MF-1]